MDDGAATLTADVASDELSAPPPSFFQTLGPGLVTGAADDDPSGIATYSQVGAQFGYGLAWTMLFSFPLMAAIQVISARIGSVTGRGIASNLRRHYSPWPEGLDHRPHEAKAFYAAIAVATLAGLALNFVGIDEIRALYWSAVLNGILAAPLMVVIMLVATNRRVMGQLILPRSLAVVGWLATVVMATATAGFFLL